MSELTTPEKIRQETEREIATVLYEYQKLYKDANTNFDMRNSIKLVSTEKLFRIFNKYNEAKKDFKFFVAICSLSFFAFMIVVFWRLLSK